MMLLLLLSSSWSRKRERGEGGCRGGGRRRVEVGKEVASVHRKKKVVREDVMDWTGRKRCTRKIVFPETG